ncbi:hypothetical protein [Povalibacter sp.]|uniref:ApeI family dehydratase n=1 Tax=Povalibacter sp. TaxID=1962978 RepID=UPI002F3F5728
MSDASNHIATLRIASDHPALPGHFPGRPIVPGVVVLDSVLQAARAWLGPQLRLQVLAQVKFIAPLLPEQVARIELKLQGDDLRFVVTREDQIVAQGVMRVSVGAGR